MAIRCKNRCRLWCGMLAFWVLFSVVVNADRLVVASLNPLATDLARQVGGDRVEIVELMKPGQDPHHYQPTPDDLLRSGQAKIFLAMGKGLEHYLPDLRSALDMNQTVVEIGQVIPSLSLQKISHLSACSHGDEYGAEDPHWWHNPKNMQRAAREVARMFGQVDPDNAVFYQDRAQLYSKKLDKLRKWAALQLAVIPSQQRVLTTSHAAFNYFCDAFGFKAVPIKGLTTKSAEKPAHLIEVVETISREHIVAVFPESAAHSKILEPMVNETGIQMGGALLAGTPDPDDPTYTAMFRHNVQVIVDALAPSQREE